MKPEHTSEIISSRPENWWLLPARFGGLFLLVAFATVSAQARPYALVTNTGLGRVSVIDTATETVVGDPIPVGAGPRGVAITPDGSTAYVASEFAGTVTWIDTDTFLSGFLSVGPAKGVAVSEGFAYATHLNMDFTGAVAVIDTTSVPPSLVTRVRVGDGPSGIAVTPDGSTVLVANTDSNSISVIDAATYEVSTFTDPSYNEPTGVAITPDRAFVLVANNNSNTVSVVETTGYTVMAAVQVGLSPLGVAITPDGERAYVTNQFSDSVAVLRTTDFVVLTTIDLGLPTARPAGVAITPDGTRAYVANNARNSVAVIDTSSNTVLDLDPPLIIGFGGFGVAITPF